MFSTKYRIYQHPSDGPFEPQVWRWWFPVWRALAWCSYSGSDWSPRAFTTKAEAMDFIHWTLRTAKAKPTIHKVDITPRNRFYVGWRWSDDQRTAWRFLLARSSGPVTALSVEVHGGDFYDEDTAERQLNYRPYVRASLVLPWTVMFALPRFMTRWVGGRTYGFRYSHDVGFLQVFYGRQTHDSRTEQNWCCHTPWKSKRFHEHRYYDLDGNLLRAFPGDWSPLKGWARYQIEREYVDASVPKRSYKIRDFDGEELYATVYLEERHWKHGEKWCAWLSWFIPDAIHRSMDIAFSKETGRKKGSWKGGTIGHSIDVRPGESVDAAMGRYCGEHDMVLLEVCASVYVPPPRPAPENNPAQAGVATVAADESLKTPH